MDTEANRETTKPQTTSREVVSGVRRVWATLRSASCTTIKNTIYFVTKVDSVKDMHIKRKVQTSDRTGKDKWWFLLHGAETDLKSLEEAWESLKLQTGWQLETCTKPVLTPPTINQLPSPDNNSSSRVSCKLVLHQNPILILLTLVLPIPWLSSWSQVAALMLRLLYNLTHYYALLMPALKQVAKVQLQQLTPAHKYQMNL